MKRLVLIAIGTMLSVVWFLSAPATAGTKVKLCHYPKGNPDNWRIIAHARYQKGDKAGAQAGQLRAEQLLE